MADFIEDEDDVKRTELISEIVATFIEKKHRSEQLAEYIAAQFELDSSRGVLLDEVFEAYVTELSYLAGYFAGVGAALLTELTDISDKLTETYNETVKEIQERERNNPRMAGDDGLGGVDQ